MNIIETRNGGYLFTLKGKLSKTLQDEYKKRLKEEENRDENSSFLILMLLMIFPVVLIHPILFSFIPISLISYYFGNRLYIKKKEETIKVNIFEGSFAINVHINKSHFFKHFDSNNIEQLYIRKIEQNKYCLCLIIKHPIRQQIALITGNEDKLAELVDLKNKIHNYFDIQEDELEGEFNYEKLELPKRKRQYFNLFHQDINDIRLNSVIHLKGNDHHITKINQLDWKNGMVSYQFTLETEEALFYHSSPAERLLFLEKEMTDINAIGLNPCQTELEGLDKILYHKGTNFYQTEQNKGKLFEGKTLLHDHVLQLLYENKEKQRFLRIFVLDGDTKAMLGEIVEEHQLQEILPETEEWN
ncbi:hypothetical protein [Flammeovirga sp. SJP92]|uniref:hypothetical protein n=1 Tax=Flammeovirga sp. SJP92 TaxID=1775430 RepID=UPI000787E33A|nr:hypothetical protein [Flammeovirga sp. SJP92]KXX67808.1 hypothetical protein AVL50_25435 [Flammeovirga sp. SJP92]